MTRAPQRDKKGYYRLTHDTTVDGVMYPTGTKLLSVTTTNSLGWPTSPDGMVMWAAGEAASCALEYLPKIVKQSRIGLDQSIEIDGQTYGSAWHFLRLASTRKKDRATGIGDWIHDAVEAHILGEPFPDPPDEDTIPIMEGFRNFLADWTPEFHAAELVVANPADRWAGTLDTIVTFPMSHLRDVDAGPVVADWKTGKGDRRGGKCEWPKTGLQLTAYARATVAWIKRTGEMVELPKVSRDRAYVVHLRPDHHKKRGYGLAPVSIGNEVYAQFLRNRDTAEFALNHAGKLIHSPLAIPPSKETTA